MELLKNERLQVALKLLLNVGAVVITLVLPYFYVVGLAFYDGEMNAAGLSSTLFPISAADIYVKAFFAVLAGITECLKSVADFFGLDEPRLRQTIGFCLVLFGAISGFDRFEKSTFNAKLKQKQSYKSNDGRASTLLLIGMQSFFCLSVLILIISWGLVFAINRGASYRGKELNRYMKLGCIFDEKTRWNSCVQIKDKNGKVTHQGILILKTEGEIAIFEKNQTLILKLNQDEAIVKLRK